MNSSIFFETHPENNDLRIDLNNSINSYQTNAIQEEEIYRSDGEVYEEVYEEDIPEHIDHVDLLTNAHLEELKILYESELLEEEAEECSLSGSQKNDYLSYLNNITCCTSSCLKDIDHQNAFRRYEQCWKFDDLVICRKKFVHVLHKNS